MRGLLPLLLLLLSAGFPAPGQGADCGALARQLTLRVGEELFPGITARERARLREIALDTCRNLSAAPAVAGEGAGDGGAGAGDWFSHEALHGRVPDKAGLRRLKRLKP